MEIDDEKPDDKDPNKKLDDGTCNSYKIEIVNSGNNNSGNENSGNENEVDFEASLNIDNNKDNNAEVSSNEKENDANVSRSLSQENNETPSKNIVSNKKEKLKNTVPTEPEKSIWSSEEVNYGVFTEESFETWLQESYLTKHGIWHFKSLEDVNKTITTYQYRTMTKYSTYFASKNFGASDIYEKSHKIRWEGDGMIYDGIPYVMCSVKQMDCHFGKTRKHPKPDKEKKKRQRIVDSKKCGCEATLKIKEAIKFPEFKILANTEYKKTAASKKLRARIKFNLPINAERVFILYLPSAKDHCQHIIGEDQGLLKERVHCDIVMHIQHLYLTHHSISYIDTLIRDYIQNEMPDFLNGPDSKKRRYNPEKGDIKNVCHLMKKLCRIDPDMVQRIKTLFQELDLSPFSTFCVDETKIHLKCSEDDTDEEFSESVSDPFNRKKDRSVETFLLIFQTPFQQRLMRKYNNVVYFVEINHDASFHKLLPWEMYLMVVPTCCDYQVVCTIVCSRQRKDALKEVFATFQEVYNSLLPKCFILDCSERICEGFETVFPDIPYFFTQDSCVKQWELFLNQASNDLLIHKDVVLSYLNDMRKACTEESLNLSASLLEASEVWQENEKLRAWFQEKWLHNAKRWVFGYIPEDIMTMNHYTDSISKATKQYSNEMAIVYQVSHGLHQLLENVCLKFAHIDYERHIENMNAAQRDYEEVEEKIHMYPLLNCVPKLLIPFLVPLLDYLSIQSFEITPESYGTFLVKSGLLNHSEEIQSTNNVYQIENAGLEMSVQTSYGNLNYQMLNSPHECFTVTFGDNSNFSLCTCQYWIQFKLPCIHMCAIFLKYREWGFDMLSPIYRINPCFQLDYAFVKPKRHIKDERIINLNQIEGSSKDNENLNIHIQSYLEKFVANKDSSLYQCDLLEKNLTALFEMLIDRRKERFVSSKDLKFVSKSCQTVSATSEMARFQAILPATQHQSLLKILEVKKKPPVYTTASQNSENNIKKRKLVPPSFPNSRLILPKPKPIPDGGSEKPLLIPPVFSRGNAPILSTSYKDSLKPILIKTPVTNIRTLVSTPNISQSSNSKTIQEEKNSAENKLYQKPLLVASIKEFQPSPGSIPKENKGDTEKEKASLVPNSTGSQSSNITNTKVIKLPKSVAVHSTNSESNVSMPTNNQSNIGVSCNSQSNISMSSNSQSKTNVPRSNQSNVNISSNNQSNIKRIFIKVGTDFEIPLHISK